MKPLFVLLLTLCLFGCKEKETVTGFPYGLVGTYEGVSKRPTYIFQDLLSDYSNFEETVTATITQTGTDTYFIQLKTKGIARKGAAPPLFNYGFTADMNGGKVNIPNEYRYSFRGKYSNFIPASSELDNVNNHIEGVIVRHGLSLEVFATIHYQEDAANIVYTTLVRIK